jgi:hypothetical protein
MNNFFSKLRPADVIGLVCVIFGFYLLSKGVDTVVGACVITIVAYYFGHARKDDQPKIIEPKPGNGGV